MKTPPNERKPNRTRWHPGNWFSNAASADEGSKDSTNGTAAPAPNRRRKLDADKVRVWYRTERVFYQNGAWYISTREGIDVGPYANSAAARRDSKRLIELLVHDARTGKKDHALTIHEFMLRPHMRHRD